MLQVRRAEMPSVWHRMDRAPRRRHGAPCRARELRLRPRAVHGVPFGLGIERVAMLKYEIPDIRMLIDGDVRFLEQFQGIA